MEGTCQSLNLVMRSEFDGYLVPSSSLNFGGINFNLVTMVTESKMVAETWNKGRRDVSEVELGVAFRIRCVFGTFFVFEFPNPNFGGVMQGKLWCVLDSSFRFRKCIELFQNDTNTYLC